MEDGCEGQEKQRPTWHMEMLGGLVGGVRGGSGIKLTVIGRAPATLSAWAVAVLWGAGGGHGGGHAMVTVGGRVYEAWAGQAPLSQLHAVIDVLRVWRESSQRTDDAARGTDAGARGGNGGLRGTS